MNLRPRVRTRVGITQKNMIEHSRLILFVLADSFRPRKYSKRFNLRRICMLFEPVNMMYIYQFKKQLKCTETSRNNRMLKSLTECSNGTIQICLFEVDTTNQLKNITTSCSNGIWRDMFRLRSVLVLSNVVIKN